MKPTTNVLTNVIVFKDGTKKFISNDTHNNILSASTKPNAPQYINLEGNLISFNSISKLLSMDEYYNQYPDNRPIVHKTAQELEQGLGFGGVIKSADKKKHLKEMIKGLKGYIDSDRYQGTEAPKELLALMDKKLQSLTN